MMRVCHDCLAASPFTTTLFLRLLRLLCILAVILALLSVLEVASL